MPRATWFGLIVLAACTTRPTVKTSSHSPPQSPSDSAFAQVQARGRVAMGVDQYTSSHRFEPLPDGGRITLTRDSDDLAGAAQIRRHMQRIAGAFGRGNFELPGIVHDPKVPGTAIMARRRSLITYTADTIPRGAQLRIRSRDSMAISAIHQFLSFQRQDHRAGGGTAH
jgi:hypothetical protein